MKTLFFLSFILIGTNSFSQTSVLLVGTYDSPKSDGIYIFDFNEANGTAKQIGHVKISNPSYLTVSPDKKFVFTVNENANKNGEGGEVTSFSVDKKKRSLSKMNTQSSEGNHPCYITIDKTARWIVTGNYSTGNAALLEVNKNGFLSKARQVIQHEGRGSDTSRQKSPHVHATVFSKNNKNLYVTDLGTDKIMCYNFDANRGKISPAIVPFIKVEDGVGPRHLVLSANEKFSYLLTELKGEIVVFESEKSNWKAIQAISSLPLNFTGVAGSADIHISNDGNFLYASNRGESNTIAIFIINKTTGQLSLIGHQPTLGLAPRNFNFDPSGKYLLVANQNSNEIVVFKIDKQSGLLTDTGNRIEVGKPVCLKWL